MRRGIHKQQHQDAVRVSLLTTTVGWCVLNHSPPRAGLGEVCRRVVSWGKGEGEGERGSWEGGSGRVSEWGGCCLDGLGGFELRWGG